MCNSARNTHDASGLRFATVQEQTMLTIQFIYMDRMADHSRIQLGSQIEVDPEDINVTFNDVKGCDEAKQELHEIVEFLKNPAKFSQLGGKLPKGVLLVGPPGNIWLTITLYKAKNE